MKLARAGASILFNDGVIWSWEQLLSSNDKLATLMYDQWGVPFDEDLRNPKAKSKKRPVNKNVRAYIPHRTLRRYVPAIETC
jgi:hypothetical protein